jgi:hypothetical protein
MRVNRPPAYTVWESVASACTCQFGFGFQARTRPVRASTAARWLRGRSLIDVNHPPTYTVLPMTLNALTEGEDSDELPGYRVRPLTTGFQIGSS